MILMKLMFVMYAVPMSKDGTANVSEEKVFTDL